MAGSPTAGLLGDFFFNCVHRSFGFLGNSVSCCFDFCNCFFASSSNFFNSSFCGFFNCLSRFFHYRGSGLGVGRIAATNNTKGKHQYGRDSNGTHGISPG